MPCIIFLCPVKFSIKSFKIPELLIDVPETATVGSLKVYATAYSTSNILQCRNNSFSNSQL